LSKPTLRDDTPFTVYEFPQTTPQAPQISKPKIQNQAKAKPKGVFGVSRKSIQSTDPNAPTIKAGNTIAKEQDQKTLQPSDADSLPIPADEVLVTRMPELISEIKIPYPAEAKKKGIQGAVVMDILIDEKGAVRQATLVNGPDPSLSEAALEAVKKFMFSPAIMQEKPVAVRIRYAYRFILER
jgi:protein TonB